MVRLGSYEIIRQIGEGGFGRTYEGRHVLNNNIKACLKQNINITDEDAKLLMREAELLTKISHYSFPAFRDLYRVDDGSIVLAMDFAEGRTLDKIVEKHKGLHPEEVAWIAQRSLQGLYYLHHKGVIHGDVKPPNMMIQPWEHNVVLVDFGLSSIKPKSDSKAVGYTEVFAAPELLSGKPPLPESDLYSLGLTMIYAWGGDPVAKIHPPYVHKSLQNFVNGLVRYNVADRTNWDKEDLVKKLSDARLEAFGRRRSIKSK
ncbi:serine/threonine protein kinase [archaeon]|jgi:eukaryotic-like serine/threonine-protein kinase|nr:serine/threonine protein kinase [archaeon]MBT3451324.1 serine/threonine protein kinase [archaeon]MBT6869360.1 serine/threonine protein kinase [archaeon]MBT7192523.1 serine/threonine protein kinase [archaeon]MBT7380599.1 serine/threonine protein kinase [archaeon]